MRERLKVFLRGLRERDIEVCDDAPAWVLEEVASKAESLLKEQLADDVFQSRVETFVLGVTRFVADQCGSECDALLSAINSLPIWED
jgi:hypothetical protein